ncbi:hypothetical protein [Mycobacterium asiaticum]|uniref:hypothetical protein n=1 Tax=Mycobacterium asiaticum TaxID=1790 RepID=UPI000A717CB7|nr:hypothetical protein [Mycobacterium asiaticum]
MASSLRWWRRACAGGVETALAAPRLQWLHRYCGDGVDTPGGNALGAVSIPNPQSRCRDCGGCAETAVAASILRWPHRYCGDGVDTPLNPLCAQARRGHRSFDAQRYPGTMEACSQRGAVAQWRRIAR